MTISIILVLVGFSLLIKGADWMVHGASTLAKKHNVSDLVIGLTIVAFGTSAPELIVNTVASFGNHSDIILGNVIGSNIFNLFVILGIVGLIFPITVHSSTVWKEIPISFFAIVSLFVLANGVFSQSVDIITKLDGLILFAMFLFFLVYIYSQMKGEIPNAETASIQFSNSKIWSFVFIGLAGLVIGGKLVVDNAIEIAMSLEISEKIIGLTIVAAGTSLPELITSIVAAVKKNNDIAIGNIVGSNIFNIFLILSLSAMINPIEYNNSFNTELYFLAGGTVILFVAMFTGKKKHLDRWEAAVLLLAFVFYTLYGIGKDLQ